MMTFRVVHKPSNNHARCPYRIVEQSTGREIDWINQYLDYEMLRRLGQARVNAPPPVIGESEPPGLVLAHERVGILRLQPSEVVAPGQHQKIAREAVPAELGHLPRSVRPGGGHGAIERPAFVSTADVVASMCTDQVEGMLNGGARARVAIGESGEVDVEEDRRIGQLLRDHDRARARSA